MDRYVLKRAELQKDAPRLRAFFNVVFTPENVGNLAENLFRYFPGMEGRYWFIAEDRESGNIAAACALLPWGWCVEGISLKVAEMGIVGTGEEHRSQGLMRRLHGELMKTVEEEHFDLVVIQGIPGFYDRLGFRYALPLCSHVELPLHAVPSEVPGTLRIRPAGIEDIPFLMGEDKIFAAANSISAPRDREHWQYLVRAGAAAMGIYGNNLEEAYYPSTEKDMQGLPLDASNGRSYLLTFSREDLPQVKEAGFWSITMYNLPDQLMVENPIHRYSLGDRTNLAYQDDGSLEIIIQTTSPDQGNWLPAPEGPFSLTMRMYLPEEEALDPLYGPPALKNND